MSESKPWLANKHWKDNAIASSAGAARWGIWGFAIFWNIFNVVLYFQADSLVRKMQQEPLTVLVLLFPLSGAALIVTAIRATQRYRKFGPTPLTLDPFPGVLGGHVGGRLTLPIPSQPEQRFNVTLSCLHSTMSGSGKDRRRRESIKWQSQGVCHSSVGSNSTALQFRFDAPAELPASDIETSNSYYLWRVQITATMDGPDFERSFDIPVFATAHGQSGILESTESNVDTIDAAMEGIQSVANIQSVPHGIEAYFPALQRPLGSLILALVGLIFAIVGSVVGLQHNLFFGIVFTAAGSALALCGLYGLSKSLRVSVTREGIRARRFVLGYPVTTRQIAARDIRELKAIKGATVSSGNRTTVFYSLSAVANSGKVVVIGERLSGSAEVALLKETYETYLEI